METTIKITTFILTIVYFLVAFVIPTYRTWKMTGIAPVTFSNSDNAHDYIGKIFKILLVLLFITVTAFAFSEVIYTYFSPIIFLQHIEIQYIGLFLLVISLIWIVVAQAQMSTSWRIGIDEKNKTRLVTEGVFSISRNPIFLGMIVTLLGLFLILPNAITFCILVTVFIVIQIQVRLEEEFLLKQHGNDYTNYQSKTKRFL